MIDLWPMAAASKSIGGMMPKIVEGIVIGVALGLFCNSSISAHTSFIKEVR